MTDYPLRICRSVWFPEGGVVILEVETHGCCELRRCFVFGFGHTTSVLSAQGPRTGGPLTITGPSDEEYGLSVHIVLIDVASQTLCEQGTESHGSLFSATDPKRN